MSSTNDVRVGPGESAEAKRERRLQRRRERERAHRASETAEQLEELITVRPCPSPSQQIGCIKQEGAEQLASCTVSTMH